MVNSIFLKVEGNNPRNRIWSFLIVNSEYDYSIKEISDNSNVSYNMAKYIMKDYFKKNKLIKERIVGKAKLYHLDFNNKIVKKFIEYYWEIIKANSKAYKRKKLLAPVT
jgi:predicted transcriptional regulator